MNESLPNPLPSAFITGSACQPIRSHRPMTTVTLRAFARSMQTALSRPIASFTGSALVTTTTSETGHRSFRFPAWRAFALASSNERTSSTACSSSRSTSVDSPAFQSRRWMLAGSFAHAEVPVELLGECGQKGARSPVSRRIT